MGGRVPRPPPASHTVKGQGGPGTRLCAAGLWREKKFDKTSSGYALTESKKQEKDSYAADV